MKCPGQDSQYWKPGAIYEEKCPDCGTVIEFFKDDPYRKCGKCGKKIVNPRLDFGCAAYCPFAEQCLGTLPEEFLNQRADLLKDRVAVEMKRYFQPDFKRIGHATRVARHAEQIGKQEKGHLAVILMAAYLHDIGIKEAERKYNSSAARYQELEGPPIARAILEKLGAPAAIIDEVCDIVGHHHHPRPEETTNFKAVYDADQIANLEAFHEKKPVAAKTVERLINNRLLTEAGKARARTVLSPPAR